MAPGKVKASGERATKFIVYIRNDFIFFESTSPDYRRLCRSHRRVWGVFVGRLITTDVVSPSKKMRSCCEEPEQPLTAFINWDTSRNNLCAWRHNMPPPPAS